MTKGLFIESRRIQSIEPTDRQHRETSLGHVQGMSPVVVNNGSVVLLDTQDPATEDLVVRQIQFINLMT